MAFGFEKIFRNAFFTGGQLVTGNTTFQGDVNIEGSMAFEETLAASSDVTIAGTLKTQGNSSFNGTLDVDNTVTGSSKITATNLLTASSAASVAKTLTASSDVDVNNTLTVSSGATFTLGSTFSAGVTVDNTLTVSSGFSDALIAISSGVNIPNHGIVMFDSTGAGTSVHNFLRVPVAGQTLRLINRTQTGSSATNIVLVSTAFLTNAINIISTQGSVGKKVKLQGVGASMTLVGLTTSEWGVTDRTPTTNATVVNTTTTT